MNLGRMRRGGEAQSAQVEQATILDGLVDAEALLGHMQITMHAGALKNTVVKLGQSMGLTIGGTMARGLMEDNPYYFPETKPDERIVLLNVMMDMILPLEVVEEAEAVIEEEKPELRFSLRLLKSTKDSEEAEPDEKLAIAQGIIEIEEFVVDSLSPDRLAELEPRLREVYDAYVQK